MKNKKHGLTLKQRGALHGYAFISIWIISFFVFVLYPVIYSMILSVNAIKIRPEGIIYTFKGLFFYDYALNELPHFRNCLAVQLQMVCGMTPVILVLSLIVAMLLNGKFRGRAMFRAIFFMPVIIMSGPVISSLLGQYALDFSTNSRIVYDLLSYMPSAQMLSHNNSHQSHIPGRLFPDYVHLVLLFRNGFGSNSLCSRKHLLFHLQKL